jgi:spermidine/putrescine-binding protein
MNRTSNRFSRRRFMHKAGLAMAAAAAGKTLLPRVISPARASGSDNVIRVLGVTTGAPDSWDEFEKATGFKVEWTPIGDDVGLFLHEMIGNDGGERYDLVSSLSGTYETLADQQLLMPVDTGKLKNWSGVSDLIRTATPQAPGGKGAWSVPFQFNADSFAYFAKALGEPDAPAEVSWSLLYDDKRTLGKSALDNGIYALLCCAIYLKHHGLVQIDDIANLTASEAASVSNYLIERKQAGQFRTLYKSYDEQVELLESREVLAASCWEPAAMDARGKGLDVAYAYTLEGYDKWSQNLMIPAQVKDRGASDKVHVLIDWFMGGAYAAEKSATQGYLTPRPDLGLAYAQEKGWDGTRVAEIQNAIKKLDQKFLKKLFWDPGYFKNMEIYEREVARFKNA